MAENAKPLNDLDKLTQDIISRFETALNVSTTAQLSSIVEDINKSLEKQTNLIQNIAINSTSRLQQTRDESENVKVITEEVQKQSAIYQDILAHNDAITENWDTMIKQSATIGKSYKEINKEQKKYLTSLNAATKQEKKLTDLTLKRMKVIAKMNKTTGKSQNKSGQGRVPQFVDIQGISSTQIGLESLTGGRPYFASHPEMGVPMGLFNTKDEPNRAARIRAIKKYGSQGSISGAFPQYADDLPTLNPQRTDANDLLAAGAIISRKILDKAKPILNEVIQIIDTLNNMADKFIDAAGEADEAIRSSIQSAGVLMQGEWTKISKGETPLTKAEYFQQSMQQAAEELNFGEGVYASYEMLANLQKSFTEYSKTNVLLGKEDLKNLIYLQGTFDLATNDVAEIQGAFMELGMSSEDMMEYANKLAKDARKFGVSSSKLLKDTAKLMKLGASYRFKGGVKDMEKMQVYAANARFEIERAYSTMDKTMSIEGAVELASQLQVLGGEFADIDAMELFAAAQTGDMESFTKQIVEKFRKDSERFGKVTKEGMFEYSSRGRILLNAFQNVEGFDLGDDIKNIIEKAGKEEEIRKRILSGANKTNFLTKFTTEQQNQIVQNIAQGSVKSLNLTGQDLMGTLQKDMIDFSSMVLDEGTKMLISPESVRGAQSTKDILALNEQWFKLQSQQGEAINGATLGLQKLKDSLIYAGEAIFDLGLTYLETPFFKKLEIMNKYLGLSVEEAVIFQSYFEKAADGGNRLAGMFKAMIEWVSKNSPEEIAKQIKAADERGKAVDEKLGRTRYTPGGSSISREAHSTQGADVSPWETMGKKHGGILQAAGGMVMGESHFAGGVRGTGRFNNVEVEGGEAIINKRSTQMFLPLLSKLNEIGGGESFGGNSTLAGSPKDKTINVRIHGDLKYISNITNSATIDDLEQLAEDLDTITNGRSFGGLY